MACRACCVHAACQASSGLPKAFSRVESRSRRSPLPWVPPPLPAAPRSCVILSLLLGGAMCAQGVVTPEQLTGFIFYVQLVTSSSLAVCDQWGAIMEVGLIAKTWPRAISAEWWVGDGGSVVPTTASHTHDAPQSPAHANTTGPHCAPPPGRRRQRARAGAPDQPAGAAAGGGVRAAGRLQRPGGAQGRGVQVGAGRAAARGGCGGVVWERQWGPLGGLACAAAVLATARASRSLSYESTLAPRTACLFRCAAGTRTAPRCWR